MPMFPSYRAPETMTAAEQVRLLRATAAHDDLRDHVLYSMALGTGLRLRELLGLNVGDVSPDGRDVRRRVVLDPATTKGSRRGEVFLPARLITKLRRFLAWKRRVGQSLEADAPLFVSSQRRRLSPRAAQWRFAWWQRRAGFDRHYGFHQLRHSSITAVYRAMGNLFVAQRFARHASPLTTIVYTHPSDEELYEGIRDLRC
jgi:site-specific recombinase XerC